MRRCPACHALYPDEDRFCEVDGEVLTLDKTVLAGTPTLPVSPPPEDVPFAEEGEGEALLSMGVRIPAGMVATLVERAVELGRSFDRAGLGWQPQPEDFVLMEGEQLGLQSARGVFRREGAFDARPSLRALGEALLDAPVALCSTALVRILSDPTLPSMTPDEATAFLANAEGLVVEHIGSGAFVMHVGYRRRAQQDAIAVRSGADWQVVALCDGVSTSLDGGFAARIGSVAACDAAERMIASGMKSEDVVRDAIVAAHHEVCDAVAKTDLPQQGVEAGSDDQPGTTIVVALVRDRKATIGWAGDSRAYLVGAHPAVLTRDHSWANAMIATGHVSHEEAFSQPLAHALTRCIGPLDDAELGPEVCEVPLQDGDTLVLCSDGLWSYMSRPETMAQMLSRASGDAAQIARALVHEALMRGGHDNISIVVLPAKPA